MALHSNDEILDFEVIKTTKDEFTDTEDLIIFVTKRTMDFIIKINPQWFVIEGMAFAAKSAHKDIIAGIYWSIRTSIRTKCPHILVGSIPVQSWRTKVLNKEERKFAKENYTPKNEALKIATVEKLPDLIKQIFLDYIARMGYHKKTMYDLADSYFLGKYRNTLK